MVELIKQIRAALDEEERIARAALANPVRYVPETGEHVDVGEDDGEWVAHGCLVETANPHQGSGSRGGISIYDEGGHDEEQAQHIAHNDPAAALRRVAAHRELVDAILGEKHRVITRFTDDSLPTWNICPAATFQRDGGSSIQGESDCECGRDERVERLLQIMVKAYGIGGPA